MTDEETYEMELAAFEAFSAEAIKKRDVKYMERCVLFKREIDTAYINRKSRLNRTPEGPQ